VKNSGTGRTILSFLPGLTPQRKPSRLPLLLYLIVDGDYITGQTLNITGGIYM